MPRTEAQYEEIRETKKALIMQTALELFASEGYYTTSIGKIAQKAGISKGLMYNYFESKEDLVLEIIGRGIRMLLQHFDPDKDDFLTGAEFELMIHESFRVLQDNRDYWKLYFAIMLQPAVYNLVRENYAGLVSGMLQVVKGYYERKGIPDPESEAALLNALLDGVSLNYIMNPEVFPLEQMKKMILERFK